ncbi:hypothetical protein D9M71_274990 [compost metagenome]
MRRGVAAQHREHLHERATAVRIARGIETGQQAVPWGQRQQHHQGTDVENQDAVDHLVDGLRDYGFRLVGLSRGKAEHFQATEREHDDRQRHDQATDTIGEESAMFPQVADRGLRAAAAADQQVAAQGDHADDSQYLDDREPELRLAEDFDVGQVDQVDHHEEHCCRDPGRDLRPPVMHVFTDGGQFRHAHQDVQHPAVPARQETGETAPVLMREVAEGASHRLFDNHLAELAHDHEGDETADGVAQDHRRARRLEYPGRAEEQPSANRTAKGDQLDVAIFQAAFQLA